MAIEEEWIAVSACLLGVNCKYNGGNNENKALKQLFIQGKVVPICPEVMGGLTTPRNCSEIVSQVPLKIMSDQGEDVTQAFVEGAKKAMTLVTAMDCKKAILQSRSPSCGCKEIYDGTFSKQRIRGKGYFAKLCERHGIEAIDVEDYSG